MSKIIRAKDRLPQGAIYSHVIITHTEPETDAEEEILDMCYRSLLQDPVVQDLLEDEVYDEFEASSWEDNRGYNMIMYILPVGELRGKTEQARSTRRR